MAKCISCDKSTGDLRREYGKDAIERAYQLDKGLLCHPCAEDDLYEAPVLVFHKREEPPVRIGRYISDYFIQDDEPKFTMAWVSTDNWRGHYEIESSDDLVKVFNDQILSYHESESMLKTLNDISMKAFDITETDYYRVFSRTSNVFCANIDIYVEKPAETFSKEIIEVAKKFVNYDDPVFSTGIIFPRENQAEFMIGNVDAVNKSKHNDLIKQLVLRIGEEILEKQS